MSKKTAFYLSAVVLVLLFIVVACASGREEAQLPNPMRQSSPEEIMDILGLKLETPDGATAVEYYIIELEDASDIAQVDFSLDGIPFIYRAASAAKFTDISGMNYDWTEEIETDVSYCAGKTFMADANGTKVGVILWYDAAPGIQYSLSTDSDADYTLLWFLAEQLYEPHEDI